MRFYPFVSRPGDELLRPLLGNDHVVRTANVEGVGVEWLCKDGGYALVQRQESRHHDAEFTGSMKSGVNRISRHRRMSGVVEEGLCVEVDGRV